MKKFPGVGVAMFCLIIMVPVAGAAIVRPLSCSPGGRNILFAVGSRNDRGFVYDSDNKRWTGIEAVVGSLPGSWEGGERLGVKVVDKHSGRQYPAVVDLRKGSMTALGGGVPSAGFPVFSKGRAIVPLGSRIARLTAGRRVKYLKNTRVSSHYAPVSPDGRYIAANSGGKLKAWSLKGRPAFTGARPEGIPFWSPDGRRIAITGGNIKIYTLSGKKTEIGEIASSEAGPFYSNPRWLPDGSGLVYISWIVEGMEVYSELVCVTPRGREKWRFPLEEAVIFDPLPLPGDRVLLAGEGAADLYHIDAGNLTLIDRLTPDQIDATISQPPPPPDADPQTVGSRIIEGVPYIHQSYDTPDWANGNNMCGPASCVMVVQRYNVLPHWPTRAEYGVSSWGNYLPGLFEYNGYVYDRVSNDSSGNPARGAHGYMHTGNGAGWYEMEDFLKEQDLTTAMDTSPTFDEFVGFINDNAPCVISTNLTNAGHIIVGVGYYDNGSIIVNDPWGDKGEGYSNYNGEGALYDWPGYDNGNPSLVRAKVLIPGWPGSSRAHDTALVIDDSTKGLSRNGFAKDSSPDWEETDSYGYASTGGSHPYGNGLWYLPGVAGSQSAAGARWSFRIAKSGIHRFSVFIPSGPSGKTGNATYILKRGRRKLKSWTLDQSRFNDVWVELGQKWLWRGSYSIELTNATGSDDEIVVFDAVMIEGRGIDPR